MKVFLGNPPWQADGFYGVRAGSRWPHLRPYKEGAAKYIPFPFFLAYAAALLEKNNFNVCIADAIADEMDEEDFLTSIKDFSPDLVVLETSTPSIYTDIKTSRKIKEETGALIALCGPHVTVNAENILNENLFIDYILLGEYEFTLLKLATHLKENRDTGTIPAIASRVNNEGIKTNRKLPFIPDINDLPWPARHRLPMGKYNDTFANIPSPSLQILSSRGCPYKCIFCLWPSVMYRNNIFRGRDPINVIDEIEWCISKYSFKSFFFDDDTFNIEKNRVIKICDEIKGRNLKIPWAVMARPDIMDKDILKTLADSGLYAIKYGIESGDTRILERSGKSLDLKRSKDIVKITRDLGIKVHLTFAIGLPGENHETLKRTFDFALSLHPDDMQFSLVVPFPGTEYFDYLERERLLITKDWSKYNGLSSSVFKTEHLTGEELEAALLVANKIRQRYMLKRDLLSFDWKYYKKGLLHPLKVLKKIFTLLS